MAQLDDASLSAQLAARGVRSLRTAASAEIDKLLDAEALITALACHPAPRFRQALIPLFLRHPAYADRVPMLADTLPPPAAETSTHDIFDFYPMALSRSMILLATLRI